MLEWKVTGVNLQTYFNNSRTDWVKARQIVNVLKKADEIAGIAKKYYSAILKAKGKEKENIPNYLKPNKNSNDQPNVPLVPLS